MKLLANLRIKSEKNAEFLLQAFLKASNPESSILIREEEVIMELELDGLSTEIIEEVVRAIGHCEIMLLRYGKTTSDVGFDTEVEAEPETAEEAIKEESQEAEEHSPEEAELPESTEQTQKTAEDSKSKEPKKSKKPKAKCPEKKKSTSESTNLETEKFIQKLDELAKDSNTYSLFLKKVMSWFELDQSRSLFLINVLQVTWNVDKICWTTIEAELFKILGVRMNQYDVNTLRKQVSKKTKLKLLEVIKILDGYKSKFSFLPENTAETQKKVERPKPDKMPEGSSEVKGAKEENAVSKDVAEILKGSKLERRLNALDKKEPIDSRVNKILEQMEWSYLNSKDKYAIQSICEKAVRLRDITFENIFRSGKLQCFNQSEYVVILSNFIDQYMKKIGIKERIDPIAFLKYFQDAILTNVEKQNL